MEISPTLWNSALLVFGIVFTLKCFLGKVLGVRKALRDIIHCPGGQITWVRPFRPLAMTLGTVYPGPDKLGSYYAGFSVYEKYGSTILSSVEFWSGTPFYWVADAESFKAVTSAASTFQKEIEAYESLNAYGKNLGTVADGPEWRRHRTVTKPAFNEANIALVWSESLRIADEWLEKIERQTKKPSLPIVDLVSDLKQATLQVITATGFGRRTSWIGDSPQALPSGHALTFDSALGDALHNILFRILTPNWAYPLLSYIPVPYLSHRVKETTLAYGELNTYMRDIILSAKQSMADDVEEGVGPALLRNLVEANRSEEVPKNRKLTDDEILADVFVFLLAGYESTAHAVSFALALLALYPEVQSKIYDEVKQVWPSGATGAPSYKEDFPKLIYTAAAFRESLRCIPLVSHLPKVVQADAVLTSRHFSAHLNGPHKYGDIQKVQIAIPKGSMVMLDIKALQMNPIHWGEDADKFKPERFLDTDTYHWPRDAFVAFSGGARGCPGNRSAMAQSVSILAKLIGRYEVLVPSELQGRSFEEQEAFMLKWTTGITILPVNARVELRARE